MRQMVSSATRARDSMAKRLADRWRSVEQAKLIESRSVTSWPVIHHEPQIDHNSPNRRLLLALLIFKFTNTDRLDRLFSCDAAVRYSSPHNATAASDALYPMDTTNVKQTEHIHAALYVNWRSSALIDQYINQHSAGRIVLCFDVGIL